MANIVFSCVIGLVKIYPFTAGKLFVLIGPSIFDNTTLYKLSNEQSIEKINTFHRLISCLKMNNLIFAKKLI
ncbi:MAG: hypothetical protein CVT92_08065 [Bacteroidetes bacterium HGW-Bacteroidetes-1]|nr:MAG: hypothetical protein CVT92_08065 [Bacteroidetes bacterium HGW-Bacteroidetes-1]